jgi:hypothetical protein
MCNNGDLYVCVMSLLSAQMMTWMMTTLTWRKEQQLLGKRPTAVMALMLVGLETLQPQQKKRSLSALLQVSLRFHCLSRCAHSATAEAWVS